MLAVYTTAVAAGEKVNSRTLLAAAVRQYWGMEGLPAIRLGRHGKPHFDDEKRQFSLSDSGGISLCALSDSPIGADIQLPRYSRPRFLDRICGVEERRWLANFHDSEAAFALLWAMKESVAKYTGRGITRPISDIPVPLPHRLPVVGVWDVHPLGDLVFSVTVCHGGAVSICAPVPADESVIFL